MYSVAFRTGAIRVMKPILCTRPFELSPKAIGDAHVFNFYGPANALAVLTGQGALYLAYATANGLQLRDAEGNEMDKGPVHRFCVQHLAALQAGALPAGLSSLATRLSPGLSP
jgi:hypothetical protein